MMKRTNLVRPLLLASFSFLMLGCGYKAEQASQYEKQLPGVWVAQRLPEVEGISVEEYARNMLLLPTDTKSCIIYSFQRNGQVSYYPFVQERGVYIPGNKQEGRWAVRGNMLYIAHGTFPLLPMFEVSFVDSCLILRQTRQMQLDYLDATNVWVTEQTNLKPSAVKRYLQRRRMYSSVSHDSAATTPSREATPSEKANQWKKTPTLSSL